MTSESISPTQDSHLQEPDTAPGNGLKREALIFGALFLILLLGAYFRFAGLDWDDGHHLHPDERFLTIVGSQLSGVESPFDYLKTSTSTLNPYNSGQTFYVYGNFPMTVTRYVAEAAASVCETLTPEAGEAPFFCGYRYTSYDGINIIGRFMSGLVDLVSIAITFLIARRLYNWRAGLIAALLLALAVLPIQQSHFFTMDNWAAAFSTAAIYAAVRAATLGDENSVWRLRWWVLFGLALGLAVASRINVAPLAAISIVSAAIWLSLRGHTLGTILSPSAARDVQRAIVGLAVAAVVSLFAFRIAQPYAFADRELIRQEILAETGQEPGVVSLTLRSLVQPNPQFLSNMAEIQRLQSPEAMFPPAIQWTDRAPLLFPFTNMVLYGMGLTAGLFAWFAVLWALWRMFRPTAKWGSYPEWMVHAIPVSWTLLYFIFTGIRWVKSVRYFLPIYPTLFVVAGWALVYLWQLANRPQANDGSPARWKQAAVAVLGVAIILPSFLWALSFTQIYREPITRVAASEWMFENVPSGATLIYETADGTEQEMPLPFIGFLFEHQGVPLNLDFQLPEDGKARAVRFNYLSDPDGQAGPGDSESLSVTLNNELPVVQSLDLGTERQAVRIDLLPRAIAANTPQRIVVEAGPGGTVRAGTSIITADHWDDALPVDRDGRSAYGAYYKGVASGQVPVTHPDSPEKLEQVLGWLDEADYIVLSSQRALWQLPRMALTYPLMMRYYEGLFNEELGFELAAQFHGNLRVGPLTISDTAAQLGWIEPPEIGWPPPGELAAEEAFSVYDHPPVWIFAKTDRYDATTVRQILDDTDLSRVIVMNPLEATRARNGLELPADKLAEQRSNGTFDEIFSADSLLNRNPWLAAIVWLLATILLGWAVFPLASIALPGLPDKGYALSRVLGLLLLSYFPWLMASLGILPNTRGTILLVLLGLIAVSLVFAYGRRSELTRFVRQNWLALGFIEVLGVALFVLMLAVRLGNPDVWDVIWGGEKPMDLSYFTAVLKSTSFPPYDPWYAGGYINYYYYGFVFVGSLTKLLGITPTIAYNLILPTLFMYTGLGVFSLAANLVLARKSGPWLTRISDEETLGKRIGRLIRHRAVVAGLIAVLLAIILGNLAQTTVVANAWYQTGNTTLEEIPLIGRALRTVDGGFKALTGTPAPIYPSDWFWNATRAINAEPGEVAPITEFPFFTYLYGDLHAHMISMPITLLALGWSLSLALMATNRDKSHSGSGRSAAWKWAEVAVLWLTGAIAIGSLRATNTWDFPTYLFIGVLAVLYYVFVRSGRIDLPTVGKAGFLTLSLVVLSILTFWPFAANYGTGYSSVSFWPGSFTRVYNYLLIYGLFLFIVVTHLYLEFRDWAAHWTDQTLQRLKPVASWLLLILGLLVVTIALLVVRGYWIAPIVVPIITVAGILAIRPGISTARRIVLALIAAAFGLTFIVEVVVLDGDIGRMNTVFKFYLQSWLMLSVACGPATVWSWQRIRLTQRTRKIWQSALALLMLAGLLYPLLAAPAKLNTRMNKDAPNTLDGMAFMPYVEYGDTDYAGNGRTVRLQEDYEALRWMQRNIEGSPVVAEAHGSNPYRSIANRVAMYTGLPAIIGWDWHQRQQRAVVPEGLVRSRIDDVNTLFNTADLAQASSILDKYDVGYVFLGSLEKTYYHPDGVAKFESMVDAGYLTEVYQDDFTQIYEVAH